MSDTQPGDVARTLLRIPVPWVYVLTYLLGALLHRLFPIKPAWLLTPATTYAGMAIFAVGFLIAGWAWSLFQKARTTRVPGRTSTTLVDWGPYKFTRNPMYVGLALAYVGEAGMLHQLWPVFLLPLCLAYVNWIVIPIEESRLEAAFGDQYIQLKRRVRRWF